MSRRKQGRMGVRPAGRAAGKSRLEGASPRGEVKGLKKLRQPLLLLFLALLTLATFWKVLHNDFILYDDNVYVTKNSHVLGGLSWPGLRWAFTTGYGANWHPLTWLSHMTDVSLFGLNPSGHHAISLALHVVNTLLLFLVLRSLSGRPWPSAFAAGLFAVHPAHVESVAWIAERKDLLSAVFWFATMGAYGWWLRRRGSGRYAVVLLAYATGLMSKPMLVTLPFVLLLLDFWPLRRLTRNGHEARTAAKLVLEKAPLFAVAAAASVMTFFVQRAGGAVGSLEKYPLGTRLANALVAYMRYLRIFVWPSRLAIFYPHPGSSLPILEIVGAALLLAGITAGVVALRRRAPFLLVGWLWFLGTLTPVIGLVQVGNQAMADRYTYVPIVGLFIAVAWAGQAAADRWKRALPAVAAIGGAILIACAFASAAQARVWRNSETLFLHAIAVTPPNNVARNNLAEYYNAAQRPAEALPHLYESLRINPAAYEAYNNLGQSLFLMGRLEEAAQHFSQALKLRPGNSVALNNLARVRFLQGEIPLSIRIYRAGVSAQPDWAEMRARFAVALLMERKTAEAVAQLQRANALAPKNAEARGLLEGARKLEESPNDPSAVQLRQFLAGAHSDAAAALRERKKNREAEVQLRRALELSPSFTLARNALGVLLLDERRFEEATVEFERVVSADPGSAQGHNNLGYTLYLRGQRNSAIEQYQEALRIQPNLATARNNLERALRDPR